MTKAEKLTDAILASMGKEGDPIGIMIEAVLEVEFQSYEDLLILCKESLDDDMMSTEQEMVLRRKIDAKLNNENKR